MTRTKKILLLVALFVFLLLPWYRHLYGCNFVIKVTSVSTTDLAGNPKAVFHPGDNVRYLVTFELNVSEETKVIAKGSARGPRTKPGGMEGLFLSRLERQAELLDSGTHSFSWDESLPSNALAGEVSFKVKVKIKDGESDLTFGALTVEEGPSKIAFTRIIREGMEDENRDVWIMNPDGTDQEQLTFAPGIDRSPSLSPNGMQIAFASDRTGNMDIWILDRESNNLTQLTDHPADDTQPEWSPNGKTIAFTSERGGSMDVWTIDVDSGDLKQLTSSNLKQKGPHWSPNDKLLAFVNDKDGNDDIWRMKARTGRKKTQLTFDIGDQRSPAWSPSNKEIAFTWWEFAKTRANIYVMDKNGENVRQLTFRRFYDRGSVYSPNGGLIAFYSNRAGNFDIWSMRPDGGNMTQITFDTRSETSPDWKKDGFSHVEMFDTEVTGKGKDNVVFFAEVHLAKGGALQVEMSWDDDANLDLAILEPDGNLVRWKNPEGFGRHKGNVDPGPGTEVYTLSGAPRGDYLIGAYYKNFQTTAHWKIRWRDGSFEPVP